jgi:hypothetical protein
MILHASVAPDPNPQNTYSSIALYLLKPVTNSLMTLVCCHILYLQISLHYVWMRGSFSIVINRTILETTAKFLTSITTQLNN